MADPVAPLRTALRSLPERGPRQLNIGCGVYPLPGWINLDAHPEARADLVAAVPPIPYPDASLDAIYLGHVLEHLDPAEARALLAECRRTLVSGGRLGVVVPDTRRILRHYFDQDHQRFEFPLGTKWELDDLDSVCQLFLYSTVQDSHHRWSYDAGTLQRRLAEAGFTAFVSINVWMDPRISCGHDLQCGWDAMNP